jgi:hypothetical protein
MRYLVILTAAIALAAAGCSRKSPPAPTANQADYLPFAEGHEWYMDAAMETSTGEVKKGTAHRVFEETVKQDGHTYIRSRTTIEFPPFPKQEYTKLVRKDEKGFHAINETNPGSREQVEIPLPLTVGHHWERTDGTRTLRDNVVGIETLEIGGVVFRDCFHIHSEAANEKMTQDYWEAPNVGNIKSVSVLPTGARITVSLHEFKPGKK